jgi:hypothetical protein
METKELYNHRIWPSPKAVIVVKNLNLDYEIEYDSKGHKKRLTHLQALELLAEKTNRSLSEFLMLSYKDACKELGCYSRNWKGEQIIYNPIYKIYKPFTFY